MAAQSQPSTSPVHRIQQTASNLADAILAVGEKMKSVQEGHTPPWGLAIDPNAPSSPDLDSCKEANTQSSGSSSVTSPVKEHMDGKPTIILDSPDTLTVVLQHMASEENDKAKVYIKESLDSNKLQSSISLESTGSRNRMSSSDGFSSADIKPDKLSYLNMSSTEDDIVFSQKKGKKKRSKSGNKFMLHYSLQTCIL